MNATTLTLAAALAALCALPAVTADVDVTVQPVHCGIGSPFLPLETPPSVEPSVTVGEDCSVSLSSNAGPQANCTEVGPFAWLHPYVHLDSDCDLTVRY